MTRLGVVNPSGVITFSHHEVNQCRVFLNDHGLDCTYEGWNSENHYGGIYYNATKDLWTAAYWSKRVSVLFKVA